MVRSKQEKSQKNDKGRKDEKIREAKNNGEWFKTAPVKKELEIPVYIRKAFAANEKALDNFNNLANGYKRQLVGWITSAKKEETRKRRLAEAVRLLGQNKKLGMK